MFVNILVRIERCLNLTIEMVDSKNNHNNHEALKISTGTIVKSIEMLRFVYDHLKTKYTCKNGS